MALFLDIEGTIIDEFYNPVFIEHHIPAIKRMCDIEHASAGMQDVHFFSWAIHNEADIRNGMPIIQMICDRLELDSSECVIVQKNSLVPVYDRHFPAFSREDFQDLTMGRHGKEFAFQQFIRRIWPEDERQATRRRFKLSASEVYTLIDDCVENTELRANGKIIRTINIGDCNEHS